MTGAECHTYVKNSPLSYENNIKNLRKLGLLCFNPTR